jgi:hypothetical protein
MAAPSSATTVMPRPFGGPAYRGSTQDKAEGRRLLAEAAQEVWLDR